jgi:hypothetical protein
VSLTLRFDGKARPSSARYKVRRAACWVPDRYDDDGMATQHEVEMAKGEQGAPTLPRWRCPLMCGDARSVSTNMRQANHLEHAIRRVLLRGRAGGGEWSTSCLSV